MTWPNKPAGPTPAGTSSFVESRVGSRIVILSGVAEPER